MPHTLYERVHYAVLLRSNDLLRSASRQIGNSILTTSEAGKKALVVVLTEVASDPRVRRQIDWLSSEGWIVDSLGLGESPPVRMREHFTIAPRKAWTKSFLGL